jgi:hypothetical protein
MTVLPPDKVIATLDALSAYLPLIRHGQPAPS